MEAEHTVDRYDSERVFEHANILFALAANDYIWNMMGGKGTLSLYLRKNVSVKIKNFTISNFYNLLFRMMESLKMLDKHSVRKREYGVSLHQRMAGERSSFYTFKDFCAICWQYYILIINCSSKEKMKNRDAKFKVIQIAKMNNAWLLY